MIHPKCEMLSLSITPKRPKEALHDGLYTCRDILDLDGESSLHGVFRVCLRDIAWQGRTQAGLCRRHRACSHHRSICAW